MELEREETIKKGLNREDSIYHTTALKNIVCSAFVFPTSLFLYANRLYPEKGTT
jgi:hypothetical protein